MNQFASAKRKGDVVITIYQDNEEKKVKIKDCNENIESTLGYSREDLIEEEINKIFTPKIIKIINDHIDFNDINYDIGAILAKIRSCKIVTKDKRQVDAMLKIFPCFSKKDKLYFEVLIRNFSFYDRLNRFREVTIDYDSYHTLPELDIIDYDTLTKEIETLQQFHNLDGGESIVSNIALTSKDKLDVKNLKIIIKAYKESTRKYDIIGHGGGNNLIFIILDCSDEDFLKVLNRIERQIVTDLDNKELIKIQHTKTSHENVFVNFKNQVPLTK